MNNYQTPYNYSPALVNILFAKGKKAGEININSFYLTLLDLINKKYVSVKIVINNKTREKTETINLLLSSFH